MNPALVVDPAVYPGRIGRRRTGLGRRRDGRIRAGIGENDVGELEQLGVAEQVERFA